VNLYVPRARAVDANVREREQIGYRILGSGHIISTDARERLVPV
jgi:hypothetical protein